jgi:type II secretory pathway pseudopilin PulG
MSRPREVSRQRPSPEAGFTLIEALVAIVILIFGLMAVSNLFLVATTSTSVANQSTAATTAASEVLEVLRVTQWTNLVPGGDLDNDAGVATACDVFAAGAYFCDVDTPGVGRVHVRWLITAPPGSLRTLIIQVQAEGTGAMSGARSRSLYTMFRTCTDTAAPANCPAPPPPGGGL